MCALLAFVLACSDDDPAAGRTDAGLRDAGQDAAEADGGSADPPELARLAQPLLAASCARAERCCTREELVLQLGESVAAAQTCESWLLSLAQRATSLNVKGVNAAVFQWVSEALTLQRGAGFELDSDAVQACAAALAQAPCEHADDGRCQTPDREDPCLPARLLRSVARSGDACEPSSALPQCAAGLACKALPAGGGRCVKEGKAGDGCTQAGDCANDALFCGPTTRRCEQRRELGEGCAHASETTAFDGCARGLVCDSRVCVPACTTGAACDPAHDNRDCAAGLVCVGYSGRCAPPEDGRECARDSECAAGSRCTPIASNDGPRCAPKLAPGASCAPYVLACDGGFCVTDPTTQRGVCKASCADDEACARDEYCASKCSRFTTCSPSSVGCNPRLADGSPCVVNGDFSEARNDRQCASGHCDHATSTCLPKRAADSACERSAQCPTSQYCQAGTCRPLLAAGADCSGLAADACGPGSFCRDNAGQRRCATAPRQGDACDPWTGLVCLEGRGLTCIDHTCIPERARPLEAACNSDADCASAHCSPIYNRCRKRLPEGAECSPPAPGLTADDCEAGLYCGTGGECTRRGTAGTPCDSRLAGRDCLSSKGAFETGQCLERESTWRCAADALAPGDALCDGQ